MKKRIFNIVFALVLVLTLSLVTAAPVAAATLTVDTGLPNTPPNYHTIQAAVTAANPGDTVSVAAGTYDEQVVIDKSLTLQGAGDSTVIQPSGAGILTTVKTTPWYGTGTKPMAAIVFVDTAGALVTIKDLKIDGSLITAVPTGVPTGAGGWVAGLAYLETSGLVDSLTVVGNPDVDCRAAGIWASAKIETTLVEVAGCNVIGYNRAGIYAVGGTLRADYHHNEINGPGAGYLGSQVPNGIFFFDGSNGSATHNTVTDLAYTGETYLSTGIGTYDAGADVTFAYNTVSNVQNAFALSTGTVGTVVEYNEVYNCQTGVRIEAGATNSIIQYNDIHDNDFAIRCGDAMGDGNVAHYNNFVDNPGLEWTNVGEGCTYVGAVCNLHDTNILDATNNWWGDCSGPGGVGPGTGDSVSANVDYTPWLGQQLCALKIDIAALSNDDFTKSKAADDQRQALLDKVDAVCDQYGDGAYRGALNKLERDITRAIQRWIVTAEQDALIDKVDAEIAILENFVQ